MCGDMLSSSWESEQKQNNMVNWDDPKNNWMQKSVRQQISKFQDTQVEAEFLQAVQEHRIEEIYWVGGEPLMYEQHWRYMKQIIDLGDGPNIYARYNTNLSRIEYRGINLYTDILAKIRDWQVCASIDGTGRIGEYIRTGLVWEKWKENFKQGVELAKHPRQMRIDFTLTLPGLFEMVNIDNFANQLGVGILSKVVFSFTPDIILSPLALPRDLLHLQIDKIIPQLSNQTLIDTLEQLKTRPVFMEQWPNEWQQGLSKGKKRILRLEEIRKDSYGMEQILQQQDNELLEWWKSIA